MLSHWIQHPPGWFVWPAHPVWLYRVTQGLHVISGVAAIPLLLVKLWAVYPKLFERPMLGSPVRMIERVSIAVLVGAVIFQLATGLLNIAQFYPWKFFFTTTHYAMAYVAIGALAVHLGVKLPVIRDALSAPLKEEPEFGAPSPLARRTVLIGAGLASGTAALAMAGQTVPYLRWLAVLSPRSGAGPQGLPVNRTAAAAGIEPMANDPNYVLTVRVPSGERTFSRAQLAAMPQTTAQLPIACVEGWSASAQWSGVSLRELIWQAGGSADTDVRVVSLERSGIYGSSVVPALHTRDALTLIALELNGAPLNLDHGYPCRLIAPNRPGVLQTKWLSRVEVVDP